MRKNEHNRKFEVDEYVDLLKEKYRSQTGKRISRSKIVEICLKNLLGKTESDKGIKEIMQVLVQSQSEI